MLSINKATIIRATLPTAEQLATHLADLPYEKIQPIEFSRTSFVRNPKTHELVAEFPGGYSFRHRLDEKIIPAASVKAAVAEREAEYMDKHGLDSLTNDEAHGLRIDVLVEMAKGAPVKTRYTYGYYLAEKDLLVIVSTTPDLVRRVLNDLLRLVGSIKTTTIHIALRSGLTQKTKDYFAAGEHSELANAGFALAGQAAVVGGEMDKGQRASFNTDDMNLEDSAKGLLGRGFTVDKLGLLHAASQIEFTLDKNFKFQRIKYPDLTDLSGMTADELNEQDGSELFRINAALEMRALDKMVDSLCELFDYQPPKEDEPTPEQCTPNSQDLPA